MMLKDHAVSTALWMSSCHHCIAKTVGEVTGSNLTSKHRVANYDEIVSVMSLSCCISMRSCVMQSFNITKCEKRRSISGGFTSRKKQK